MRREGGVASPRKRARQAKQLATQLKTHSYHEGMAATLKDMKTWTGRTGHDQLRSFATGDGTFWLEQNAGKTSKWSKLAREGHEVAWEFGANRRYTGRLLIDGEIYTPAEATKQFLQTKS